MFKIGDYAVCPGHGVGQIVDIEEREVAGNKNSYYIIKVISNGMTVMMPTNGEAIRKLVDQDEINKVYDVLKDHNIKIDNSTWNRRYREYMAKIKTGSLVEIAEVLRALFLLKTKKNLSFGEKKMLDQCKAFLAEEISLSKDEEPKSIKQKIDSCFPVDDAQA